MPFPGDQQKTQKCVSWDQSSSHLPGGVRGDKLCVLGRQVALPEEGKIVEGLDVFADTCRSYLNSATQAKHGLHVHRASAGHAVSAPCNTCI